MKICLLGGTGQLGNEINKVLQDDVVYSFGRKSLDITNLDEVYTKIKSLQPEVIIHAAGYTNIDKCEESPEIAYEVNTLGTRNVAEISQELGNKLVYISSDYVFDGEKGSPYKETDKQNPINVYGRTKFDGEKEILKNVDKHFIVRTAWLFGHKGKNFIQSTLSLASKKSIMNVVDDQISSPTYGLDLAHALKMLLNTEDYGIYHFVNDGDCSWYQLAQEICRLRKIEAKLNPITTEDLKWKAARPKNSSLSNNSNIPLRPWQEALEEFLRTF